MTPPFPHHGESDGLLVADHTTRLARMESSYQEIIPIVSQTQAVLMSVNESLQEIRSDVKDLKQSHEDVSQKLVQYGQSIKTLDEWKTSVFQEKEERKKGLRKIASTVVGGLLLAVLVYVLGLK